MLPINPFPPCPTHPSFSDRPPSPASPRCARLRRRVRCFLPERLPRLGRHVPGRCLAAYGGRGAVRLLHRSARYFTRNLPDERGTVGNGRREDIFLRDAGASYLTPD